MEQVFLIEGMTCGGCVSRVQSAILAIPRVESVQIDLANGQAKVLSEEKIAPAELRTALAPLSSLSHHRPSEFNCHSHAENRRQPGRFKNFGR